jgi:hypothetical protein
MTGDTGTTAPPATGDTTTTTDTPPATGDTTTTTPPMTTDTTTDTTTEAPPTEPPKEGGPGWFDDIRNVVSEAEPTAQQATEAPAGFEPRIGQEFAPDAAAAAGVVSEAASASGVDLSAVSGLVDEFDVAETAGVQADMSGADVGYIADPAPGSGDATDGGWMSDIVGDTEPADMSTQWEAQPMAEAAMPDPAVTMTFEDLQPADEPQNTGIVPPQFFEDASADMPADDFAPMADDAGAPSDDSSSDLDS